MTTLPDVNLRNFELALSKDESVQQIHENGDEIPSSVEHNSSINNGEPSSDILEDANFNYGQLKSNEITLYETNKKMRPTNQALSESEFNIQDTPYEQSPIKTTKKKFSKQFSTI